MKDVTKGLRDVKERGISNRKAGVKDVTKGLRDVKERGISNRKAGLLWGLSMKKSIPRVRLNRRVSFDRRIEVPSPKLFFK